MCEPLAIALARWAASSTSSNRFATLSTQSSTVTRAIGSLFRFAWDEAKLLRKPNFPERASGCLLLARYLPKIKGGADTVPSPAAQPGQQSATGRAQHRVAPVGRDLEQRHQHECALVHLGMRQHQPPR